MIGSDRGDNLAGMPDSIEMLLHAFFVPKKSIYIMVQF